MLIYLFCRTKLYRPLSWATLWKRTYYVYKHRKFHLYLVQDWRRSRVKGLQSGVLWINKYAVIYHIVTIVVEKKLEKHNYEKSLVKSLLNESQPVTCLTFYELSSYINCSSIKCTFQCTGVRSSLSVRLESLWWKMFPKSKDDSDISLCNVQCIFITKYSIIVYMTHITKLDFTFKLLKIQ